MLLPLRSSAGLSTPPRRPLAHASVSLWGRRHRLFISNAKSQTQNLIPPRLTPYKTLWQSRTLISTMLSGWMMIQPNATVKQYHQGVDKYLVQRGNDGAAIRVGRRGAVALDT